MNMIAEDILLTATVKKPSTRKEAQCAFEAALLHLLGIESFPALRKWPSKYANYLKRWTGYILDTRVNRGEVLVEKLDGKATWVKVTDPMYSSSTIIAKNFRHQDPLGEALRQYGWGTLKIREVLSRKETVQDIVEKVWCKAALIDNLDQCAVRLDLEHHRITLFAQDGQLTAERRYKVDGTVRYLELTTEDAVAQYMVEIALQTQGRYPGD